MSTYVHSEALRTLIITSVIKFFTTDVDDEEKKMRSQCVPSGFYSPAANVTEITVFC